MEPKFCIGINVMPVKSKIENTYQESSFMGKSKLINFQRVGSFLLKFDIF